MDHSERGRRSPQDRDDFVHEMTERNRSHSTVSLLDSMERRTQRTYRYGIGLVCVGATLNWLGFAQVSLELYDKPLSRYSLYVFIF